MKKIVLLCSVVALSGVILSACQSPLINKNKRNIGRLEVGMSKSEVTNIMGPVDKDEIYNTKNVWFYYTTPKWSDGNITKDECTPLVFSKGKLVGWGKKYYKLNYKFAEWNIRKKK